MEKKLLVYSALLAGFLSFVVFSSFNEVKEREAVSSPTDPVTNRQFITGFDLNKDFTFAGEPVPMDNFDVRERLDRELTINGYLHASTILHLKTASRYFPVIEPILRNYNIPEDFKYLCVAESSLRMATSSAGAKGLWQFMESVGRAYGLEISDEVDERYHVEKSTEAACRFLKHLKNRFGSWTTAAAAYNMGETALNKRIEDQKGSSYYDLNLNEETSRYIFRVLAIKEIMQHPDQYGFHLDEGQQYDPHEYRTISVNESIPNLGDFAIQHGTTYRMLKVLNPWLIDTSLRRAATKSYEIRLPKSNG